MRPRVGLNRLLGFTLCALVAASPSKASAAAGDNIGINAARRLAEGVEYAARTLELMQQRFSVDLQGSISQIREIQREALDRSDQVLTNRLDQVEKITDDALSRIKSLTEESFDKINDLVACTPQLMTQAIQESISNIKIFGITINSKTRAELSPANQYFAARDDILASLHALTANDRVEGVVASYGEISRLAQLAQCHYRTQPIGVELVKASQFYSEQARPWQAVLRR